MSKLVVSVAFIFFSIDSYSQTIDIPDPAFLDALIAQGVDTNNDGLIQLTEALNIDTLNIFGAGISSLEGIKSFINLEYLNCKDNQLSHLDLAGMDSLKYLYCFINEISNLDIRSVPNLIELSCHSNDMLSIQASGLQKLEGLSASNNLFTSLEIKDLPVLKTLNVGDNLIKTLDLREAPMLEDVFGYTNQLTEVNTSGLHKLELLNCARNMITSFDLSDSYALDYFDGENNLLEYLNIKNGSDEVAVKIAGNPMLKHICVDQEESDEIINIISNLSYDSCVINTYCSFAPGGEHYYIQGTNTFDVINNGCQDDTIHFPFMKFEIEDEQEKGIFFSYPSGEYSLAVGPGHIMYKALFDNPDYFLSEPTNASVSFPSNASPYIQDFCIKPNGPYDDLAIQILPTGDAIPGYQTSFKLIFENKGNTILDGNVLFYFNTEKMKFIPEQIFPDIEEDTYVSWNYEQLLPLEKREIKFFLLLNKPTDTPPLNEGDILTFTANIYPDDQDANLVDNTSSASLDVINSFDPNDKTCIEGNKIGSEDIGRYLTYRIRFENTGTAAARNIVIKDIIDQNKFEIESLIPLEGSHSFFTRIRNNVVEFIFENINLPSDDENNDGYVFFKIKTKEDLSIGDLIKNKAEIFFDFNFPIITNEEETEIVFVSSTEIIVEENDITIFPNPFCNEIFIAETKGIVSLQLFNAQAKLIYKKEFSSDAQKSISLGDLPSGVYWTKVKTNQIVHTQSLIKN